MKAKEFLSEYIKINKIIENKLIEREQWKQIALGITPKSSELAERVQAAGNPQKMADAIGRYIDIEKEIDEQIDSLVDRKNDIVSVIEQIPVDEYNVLHMIYIQGLRIYEVSGDLKRSYSWTTMTHAKGLSSVEKILDMRMINPETP